LSSLSSASKHIGQLSSGVYSLGFSLSAAAFMSKSIMVKSRKVGSHTLDTYILSLLLRIPTTREAKCTDYDAHYKTDSHHQDDIEESFNE